MQSHLSPGPWNFSYFGLSTDEKTNFYEESPEGLVLQATRCIDETCKLLCNS